MIVIAGASGFVGQHLVARLDGLGRPLRLGSRRPEAQDDAHTWVKLDVDERNTLPAALEGADTLVYLVHGMRHGSGDLIAHEESCALAVRQAAEDAGLRRIVYLGGPKPDGTPSVHLASRLATGRVLREGSISTVELRASMIIGAGSESWLIVRDLARRLPVMVLPSWLNTRTQPVGIDDVVTALVAAIDLQTDSVALDVPGPEVLTAKEIILRVARAGGMKPLMFPIPWLTPALSSHWIRWVTRADYTIARQLVDGLTSDLLADGDGIWARCADLPRTDLDQAIRDAFAAEQPLPLTERLLERTMRRVARHA